MVRLCTWFVVSVLLGVIYVASPFWAAWQLREAIRSGDTDSIERRVRWDSVRSSLKASIVTQREILPEATALGTQIQPSIWQRVKGAFGASMLDRFIESYITPTGLPQLAAYGRTWRQTVGHSNDDDTFGTWQQRVYKFYKRVKRAEFVGLTRAVLEVEDMDVPGRHYVGVFELSGFEWKLTELKIISLKGISRYS